MNLQTKPRSLNKLKNAAMSKGAQESEINSLIQRLVREGTLIVYFLLGLFMLLEKTAPHAHLWGRWTGFGLIGSGVAIGLAALL